MADRKFEYEITATDDSFRRSMDRVADEAKQAGKSVGDAFKKAGDEADTAEAVFGRLKTTLAGAFTVGAVVQFGRAIGASVIEAERSAALLNSTLRATGYAAGLSGQQVEGLVQELAGLSTFDDDPIRQGVTSLLRFREISGDTFREASRLALDLATATGKDLPSAFVQVGKALQDPASGMKSLREAGVRLSEGQQELAAKLKASGDAAGAQRLVLDELAKSVGGAAAGETQGLYGSTRALANAWDDLLKTIGQLPAVAAGSQNALGSLTGVINIFKRALEQDALPGGMQGSIGLPGRPRPASKIGQLSEAEILSLQGSGGKRVTIAEPKATDKGAGRGAGAAPRDGTQRIAEMGVQMYLDQWADLERQSKAIRDEIKRTREETEQEIIRGLQLGPEMQAKATKEFEDLAKKLVADTQIGKESAILGVGGELDSLNEGLINRRVSVEEYEQAYAQLQDRLNEVRGVQKDFAKDLGNDGADSLRRLEDAVRGFGNTFTNTFADIVMGVQGDFDKLFRSIASDLLRMQISQSITQPAIAKINSFLPNIASFFSGAKTGTTTPAPNVTFSGGSPFTMGTPRAQGGPVSPGVLYPINERGIEYFAPSVRGNVIPADGLAVGGGGGRTVVINNYIDSRTDLASIAAISRATQRQVFDRLGQRR